MPVYLRYRTLIPGCCLDAIPVTLPLRVVTLLRYCVVIWWCHVVGPFPRCYVALTLFGWLLPERYTTRYPLFTPRLFGRLPITPPIPLRFVVPVDCDTFVVVNSPTHHGAPDVDCPFVLANYQPTIPVVAVYSPAGGPRCWLGGDCGAFGDLLC